MYLENPEIASILHAMKSSDPDKDSCFMLLFGEETTINIHELIQTLDSENLSFFGGLFPGVIAGRNRSASGLVIRKLQSKHGYFTIPNISEGRFESIQDIHFADQDKAHTIITLLDGLTSGIGHFLEVLNNSLGSPNLNFIGGGAGSLSLEQKPCIFTNQGFFEDVAICCLVESDSRLGIRHGWKDIEGPFIATQTDKNIIQQINWQPAFSVYREVVENDSGQTFTEDNFFSIAKGFPFGMIRENNEPIVRDPIAVGENDSLICVGEVPQNSVLYIMRGETSALIDSARAAAKDTLGNEPDQAWAFIVDCISRTLFLGDQFEEELESVEQELGQTPIEGVLSLGEIASFGDGLLEFFNKTIVIGMMAEGE